MDQAHYQLDYEDGQRDSCDALIKVMDTVDVFCGGTRFVFLFALLLTSSGLGALHVCNLNCGMCMIR